MKRTFKLDGLECANCAAKMERGIQKIDGVTNASVNFLTTKLVIEADEALMAAIIPHAEKIVKKIESHVVMRAV